jgi:hypothetical protein
VHALAQPAAADASVRVQESEQPLVAAPNRSGWLGSAQKKKDVTEVDSGRARPKKLRIWAKKENGMRERGS